MAEHATVVLIDDSFTQLSWMVDALADMEDITALPFPGGAKALEALQASRKTPHLIVTDLHMPDIDGWRLCRMIRSPEFKYLNHVPVLMIAGAGESLPSNEVARGLGVTAFLGFPCDKSVFRQTVLDLLRVRTHTNQPLVLIADDSEEIRRVIQQGLAAHGYNVIQAANGVQTLELAAKHRPDIILLDHILPDTTGLDILPTLTAQAHPVIITITGDPSPKLAVKYAHAGADAYIRKPFSISFLIEMIGKCYRERTLLQAEQMLADRTAALQRPAPDTPAAPTPARADTEARRTETEEAGRELLTTLSHLLQSDLNDRQRPWAERAYRLAERLTAAPPHGAAQAAPTDRGAPVRDPAAAGSQRDSRPPEQSHGGLRPVPPAAGSPMADAESSCTAP